MGGYIVGQVAGDMLGGVANGLREGDAGAKQLKRTLDKTYSLIQARH
jgi:hypothetical protein